MNNWNFLAGLSCLAGFVMFIFGGVATFTNKPSNMTTIDLFILLPPEKTQWISDLPSQYIQTALNQLFDLPIFILLISTGLIIFIVNGIFRKN